MINEIKAGVSKGYLDYARKEAIKKALKTPQESAERNKLLKWYSEINSSDLKVVARVFRREWKSFEKVIDSNRDKMRLKKKFGIK